MQVEAFAIRLRRRAALEAADLGARLCQSVARSVYVCHIAVSVPVIAVALATFEIAPWLPPLLIWWLKPWLDRTTLFVLSRAAFGQPTSLLEVWRMQGHVWWSQLFWTLTMRRLSPWRSFTQPVHQLEGLPFRRRLQRARVIRAGNIGSAILLTSTYTICAWSLTGALLSLVYWFAPAGQEPDLTQLFTDDGERYAEFGLAVGYGLATIVLEPFYVAAGFGMYLNRRVELEAWDIEQEFRRAFSQ